MSENFLQQCQFSQKSNCVFEKSQLFIYSIISNFSLGYWLTTPILLSKFWKILTIKNGSRQKWISEGRKLFLCKKYYLEVVKRMRFYSFFPGSWIFQQCHKYAINVQNCSPTLLKICKIIKLNRRKKSFFLLIPNGSEIILKLFIRIIKWSGCRKSFERLKNANFHAT